MIRVDSHQHYWQLNRFDYSWIQPGNAPLHKDRLPEDLHPHMLASGIDRAVLVQAAGTVDEIPWLLRLSDDNAYIAGVVGWIDLTSRNVAVALAGFGRHPRFRGIRINLPVAPRSRAALDEGLHALARHDLSCDLLLSTAVLPQAIDLIAAHPDVTFVLDHLAGVRPTLAGQDAFTLALQPLAGLPNVAMKLSGYLTAASVPVNAMVQTWLPYVEIALEILGSQRLMYGSDWPVCTQAGSYNDTVQVLQGIMSALDLSLASQSDIWGETATSVYRLTF